ncbi:MAG TPA: pyridoxamine 5'-phosphate oxidase [Nitrospiraceae bacterium]|nr:MAG: pyridoxamine 5'-phosphate oxidase [Nitrospirae bacterium GWA2_46_11]OGW25745.1 MAG: pyridoxamine 5'-phosphate oxidase [Nitrospirae bacterium GWB2_47_37]HAK87998.1 pyridoxamine 5'-phosphate oxidase [Nitrospiraceae bacterium]HCZ11885.1 pyridoxamine 5'-phosphate oxidase [Nitrospiraceae bacterium]
MNKTEILEFLNANPVFHMATIEGDKPRVRGMLMYRADENGILFHTGKVKDLHKQLTENPLVELSFNNGSFENLIQIRVSGVVELTEDIELKKEIVQKREFLKPFVEQYGYDPLVVYRLKNGTASVWTMRTNLAPKEFIKL